MLPKWIIPQGEGEEGLGKTSARKYPTCPSHPASRHLSDNTVGAIFFYDYSAVAKCEWDTLTWNSANT